MRIKKPKQEPAARIRRGDRIAKKMPNQREIRSQEKAFQRVATQEIALHRSRAPG